MIPFSPPRIDQKIIDEVTDTLRSGWITTGPKTKLFEKKLAEYCGVKNVLCLNSATAGLEMMLRWFGVGEGDEVIIPAYTYAATANVIVHCGATPVFVDVNADDFCIDVSAIEKAITSKTKAIIPVDLGGFPADYDAINALVKKYFGKFIAKNDVQAELGRIMVLADGAHSIGAKYNGMKTGTLCDATVFSFHAVKNLTTAEGGAIALNLPAPFSNEEIYKWLCIYTLHGQTKDALSKMGKNSWRYDIVEAGWKCNMTDIQASIGLVELQRYDEETIAKRKKIFDRYCSAFSKYKWAELPVFEKGDTKSSYHLFLLRIRGITEAMRDEIIRKIFGREVSVNVHYLPVPMMTYYRNRGYEMKNYPVAFDNFSREISLPVYFDLTESQVDEVIIAVSKSVEETVAAHA